MPNDLLLTDEEMAVDEGLGYPKAYAKLCQDRSFRPFCRGPPFTFIPFAQALQEDSREKELDEMFPVINPKAKPTTKPKMFLSLLWKQLSHLGNAGFDPKMIRVDPYGNVLYYHADAASPLAWDIDHWFPCSRGGLTVPSNLRILQRQVYRRKHKKLEFLVPWWDLQVGLSISQFLSIFDSSNSDFRRRAFSWLFSEVESEELKASQTADSHTFPQHFFESTGTLGLAPAAVVLSRREPADASLKSVNANRRIRPSTPIIAAKKIKQLAKENEKPILVGNPYQTIVTARESLKQKEETAKMQAEIQKLDDEVSELQHKTEEEKASIQELELMLTKKRRRAEKCRRVAESQSSYRAMLEKMIRDSMHQSVVYKQEVRLNQAAANALLARLEAQKAICDSAEKDLHTKYKQRDELQKQIRPEWERARKRPRMDDNLNQETDDNTGLCLPGDEPKTLQRDASFAENCKKTILYLPEVKCDAPSRKQLRKFLEEEQSASGGSLLENEREQKEDEEHRETTNSSTTILKPNVDNKKAVLAGESRYKIEDSLEKLEAQDDEKIQGLQFSFRDEEDEDSRRRRGKGNVEKWLQFLLENKLEDADLKPQNTDEKEATRTDELVEELNLMHPQRGIEASKGHKLQHADTVKEDEKTGEQAIVLNTYDEEIEGAVEIEAGRPNSDRENENVSQHLVADNANSGGSSIPFKNNPPYRIVPEKTKARELASAGKEAGRRSSSDENLRRAKVSGEKEPLRSDSGRAFRPIPSSPSLILEGMKKRVDCMGRKPLVLDDDNDYDDHHAARNGFIKSSIQSIKRAVRI